MLTTWVNFIFHHLFFNQQHCKGGKNCILLFKKKSFTVPPTWEKGAISKSGGGEGIGVSEMNCPSYQGGGAVHGYLKQLHIIVVQCSNTCNKLFQSDK